MDGIKWWPITSSDPYKEALEIIEAWARKNFYDQFVATLLLDGELETELVVLDQMGYLIWDNDWWEGQKDIRLLGFCPVHNMYYLGEPKKDRRCYYVLTDPDDRSGADG